MFIKVIDPICGMQIEPMRAAGESTYQGQTYYFCSEECKSKFDSESQKYAVKTHQAEHRI